MFLPSVLNVFGPILLPLTEIKKPSWDGAISEPHGVDDVPCLRRLVRRHKGACSALLVIAYAVDAAHVILQGTPSVVVNNHGDSVCFKAGKDIRGEKNRPLSCHERVQREGLLQLLHIAVNLNARDEML